MPPVSWRTYLAPPCLPRAFTFEDRVLDGSVCCDDHVASAPSFVVCFLRHCGLLTHSFRVSSFLAWQPCSRRPRLGCTVVFCIAAFHLLSFCSGFCTSVCEGRGLQLSRDLLAGLPCRHSAPLGRASSWASLCEAEALLPLSVCSSSPWKPSRPDLSRKAFS